jgi:hypothetical protein
MNVRRFFFFGSLQSCIDGIGSCVLVHRPRVARQRMAGGPPPAAEYGGLTFSHQPPVYPWLTPVMIVIGWTSVRPRLRVRKAGLSFDSLRPVLEWY